MPLNPQPSLQTGWEGKNQMDRWTTVLVYDPGCHFKNVRRVCIKQCRETKISRPLVLLHEHHREGLPLLFRWQKFEFKNKRLAFYIMHSLERFSCPVGTELKYFFSSGFTCGSLVEPVRFTWKCLTRQNKSMHSSSSRNVNVAPAAFTASI